MVADVHVLYPMSAGLVRCANEMVYIVHLIILLGNSALPVQSYRFFCELVLLCLTCLISLLVAVDFQFGRIVNLYKGYLCAVFWYVIKTIYKTTNIFGKYQGMSKENFQKRKYSLYFTMDIFMPECPYIIL